MNNLEIKSIHSPDVEIDLWQPDTQADVCFLLEVEIGEAGKERADVFQLMVATPEGLRQKSDIIGREFSVLSDRALVTFSEFSWRHLHQQLTVIIEKCTASSWEESVLRLQRYFSWEYEDYVLSAKQTGT